MMNYPLLLTSFMHRVAKFFPKKEIVSIYQMETFRYNYADWYKRVCRLSHALNAFGIKKGDRVASFSLNNHRHLELYFGVPCMGAVLHTLNIRLPLNHLVYIINHAENRILFVDEDVYFLLEPIKDKLKTIEKFVIMSQGGELPETTLSPIISYEDFINDYPEEYDFSYDRDENEPALICYTSATTGEPKGVVYSHRGLYLHSFSACVSLGGQEGDCALHVVPMFHVNAWGAPFACTMLGMKQVLPGRNILDMGALCKTISEEKVTFTCGVPTIWMMFYQYLENGGAHDFSSLRAVFSGGSAMPPHVMKVFEEKYGIKIVQGYGATETSPLATLSMPKSYMLDLPSDYQLMVRSSAGIPVPGIEVKIINSDGNEVKRDGIEMGEILIRGPWVADEYYKNPEQSAATFKNGWLHIGDIGNINDEGYISLIDRKKDLIKSAGEWISSVDLENLIMSHPKVREAAVIGIPDEKWEERPCACIVPSPGKENEITKEDIINFLKDKISKYWLPDEVIFMKEIPKTTVGKFSKKDLRNIVFSMLNIKDLGKF